MNQYQQRHFDALRRVQDYLDSRAGDVLVLKECEGRKRLDDAVAQIAASSNEQGTAIRKLDGLLSVQKDLVSELRYQHMQPIATFARARLHGVPDFAALTRSTLKLRPKPLAGAARAMATAALAHADALAKGGFPDGIAKLNAVTDALKATIDSRANTRVAKVSATKTLRERLQEGRQALAMLHAVVSNQFGRDAAFMAGWSAARRVGLKVGAVHGARTTINTPDPTPAATGQTPAAKEVSTEE